MIMWERYLFLIKSSDILFEVQLAGDLIIYYLSQLVKIK